METIKDHDKYLDPPDEPTHGPCDDCDEIFDYGDMTDINGKWVCDDCLSYEMDLQNGTY
jgi:formylmethanofuran dehydrogenase subunit E